MTLESDENLYFLIFKFPTNISKQRFTSKDLLLNKRQRIPKGQSKMDIPDMATYGTQDEEKQNKNTTQYVLDTTIRKQTHTQIT